MSLLSNVLRVGRSVLLQERRKTALKGCRTCVQSAVFIVDMYPDRPDGLRLAQAAAQSQVSKH